MAKSKHGNGFIDRTSHRYGRLVVQRLNSVGEKGTYWKCLCDCGKTCVVYGGHLSSARTISCGCFSREAARKRSTTHGLSKTRAYHAWHAMIKRCTNEAYPNFSHYGGRGIGVCLRWYASFKNFYVDMGDPPTSKHSLDRINNDGHYTPNNCRWATRVEQARNTRRTHLLTFNEKTQCLSAWAEETGISGNVLERRLYKGWPPELALTKSVHKRPKHF